MIKALSTLFEINTPDNDDASPEHRRHLAAAALLIETARADFTQDGVEEASMMAMLQSSLGLSDNEVGELLRLANEEVDAATSLYQFTRIVNDHFTPTQKTQLVGDMWRVAYADGNVDKYEEHLIRRVADLVYVAHEDYIRAKLSAANAAD
ncbi:TerB family tellurite resistance protein [Chromatocurvus halotolerans]|uniref:Putative tellurite resistance protein B-like protein n=1 Tax=Chromatocurvus halotolerans TaxID=1132028 RepID=A0A4R2KZK1_9GAMM|nr:TerB family tellurite resistance protein [Chromatocurvus halotolerans]TCO78357.1 putative tellurite resistance protein B-like protein [Chromatocurvus halotolerans]